MKGLSKRTDRNNGITLFDDAFGDFFKPLFWGDTPESMKTDIKEYDNKYEMEVEMPGFDKSDIAIQLTDGNLTVCAKKEQSEDGGADGNYVRRERTVSCSRSYYVGDLQEEDVKAKYENGVLHIAFPKAPEKLPENKRIYID